MHECSGGLTVYVAMDFDRRVEILMEEIEATEADHLPDASQYRYVGFVIGTGIYIRIFQVILFLKSFVITRIIMFV